MLMCYMETYPIIKLSENNVFHPLDLFAFRGNKSDVIDTNNFVKINIKEGTFTHFGMVVNSLLIPNLEPNKFYILYFKIGKKNHGLKIQELNRYIRKYIYYDDLNNATSNALYTKLKNNPFHKLNLSKKNDIFNSSSIRKYIKSKLTKKVNSYLHPISNIWIYNRRNWFNLIMEFYISVGFLSHKKNYINPNLYLNDMDIFPNTFEEVGFVII